MGSQALWGARGDGDTRRQAAPTGLREDFQRSFRIRFRALPVSGRLSLVGVLVQAETMAQKTLLENRHLADD
ncbi:hypothetical protein [Hyphomonas sp.]|uniref:hypothetical protein n=1 Tax=Hyphomonas sp. TaxID=87 RepID=UPI00329A50EA